MYILTLTFEYFSLELIDQILGRSSIFTYLSAAEEFLLERIYIVAPQVNVNIEVENPVGLMLLFHKKKKKLKVSHLLVLFPVELC